MKNRQLLRECVIAEMNEVTKGWGVSLSTVEVTDVTVSSGSLFYDMQTEFREQSTKNATVEKLAVESDIKDEQMGHELEAYKRQ